MGTTVRELAGLVNGTVHGDGERVITAARPLAEAQVGDITFVEDDKHAAAMAQSSASAFVVGPKFPTNGKPLIQVDDPLIAFIAILRHLHPVPEPAAHGIDAKASVHSTAQVGAEPSIHAFAVVGANTAIGTRCQIHSGVVLGRNCRLGDDVVLHPNCVVYDGTVLGNRVIVHANAVIGADGFGYRFRDGRHIKIPQLGNVHIGDDVEIGAGTTIDRATFGTTRIGAGTKIDNLVQVAHNCQIGRHNVFAAQVGIAGSCTTGDYVIAGGQVGVADHMHIGTGAMIGAKSGIVRDVPPRERMFGYPAHPDRVQKRVLATMEKLPEMRRDLRRIKRHLGLEDGA